MQNVTDCKFITISNTLVNVLFYFIFLFNESLNSKKHNTSLKHLNNLSILT